MGAQDTLRTLRAAVISDVHSNLAALEAVLETIESTDVSEIWCLGDVVGYGADPDACAELIRERCDIALVGNHDLAVLGGLNVSAFSEAAAAAVIWTQENASEQTIEFLAELEPAGLRAGIGLFHASPRDPVWEYVLSVEQAEGCFEVQSERVCLIGHSHIALSFNRPAAGKAGETHGAQSGDGSLLDVKLGSWLLNPGSVGQPRDGDPRAAWIELDCERHSARFHRVDYDIDRAAAAILAAGLPKHLAERLYLGT
jgi:diadenosine tetraphosphatase ApaH/serine/threonine PP2A family protein phosphatase